MKKEITGFTLCAVLLAPCSLAQAQQQAKVPKIGWLQSGFGTGRGFEVFRQSLRELGYVESKNIAIQSRSAEGKLERLRDVAEELVRLKVDVFLTSSTDEALAAKNATRTIPIVFYGVSDPIASGLVDSLARPGGNITGYTNITAVLAGKRLELLKETIPKLSRVAVLWDPKNKSFDQSWKESQFSARELGLQLHSMEVSSAEKFESAFKEAIKARSAALSTSSSSFFNTYRKQIADLAIKNHLPAISSRDDFVTAGGLMSYGPERLEQYRRAAVFVAKILKGARPADLPVEQPTKFELVINLKTAKTLGLTIPPVVMMRAEQVIK
jgi:putative tryptophan/tyrosine transport system substrate-binding protein